MHCEHWESGACRSCRYLDIPYAEQVAAKGEAVRHALAALPWADDLTWLTPATSQPAGFRTSAKLVAGGTRRRPTLGILGADRRGIDLPGCPIQHHAINAASPGIKRFIRALDLEPYDVPTKRGELKYVVLTVGEGDALMVRFVLRTRDRVADIRRALPLLRELIPSARVVTANIHPTHEAIVEGPDEIILSKQAGLDLRVGAVALNLGPRSFTQTNADVASELYRQAAEWATRPLEGGAAPSSAWDLYCGVGGFALHLAAADIESVTGVELSDQAIASAIRGARGLELPRERARFIAADATAWAASQPTEAVPDLVVVNPPRRGIGPDLATWIEKSTAARVIYSSCNPVSLARDLTAMPSYEGVEARLFDMFPHTDHAEVALVLERRD